MWDELVKSLGTQFPIIAVVAAIVWWVLRWTTERHDAEIARNAQGFAELIVEKNARISEKDHRVAQL